MRGELADEQGSVPAEQAFDHDGTRGSAALVHPIAGRMRTELVTDALGMAINSPPTPEIR